ncbi:GNAT family N-acetyltransferase [Paenactinomyces guangxiensis]|uniref:GNAT family N-acetyltransferase n=1 Tax=Paenactinomyces guangxiensis TaxID=1490290 RepID=A0A7W1WPX8_9BACL|nr:GNAT family N-acetyltransferase [Paenactinomyces guangxiensis]MBA4493911.1 GNAT family N-acetyltransferase [Paenactinomyces guangxiensis]MBH8591377.1 GNAT family N-acetyltransferase [Paenactinomyces guangxiensis]
MFHRRLKQKERDCILKDIKKEKQLLFYSYLTVRQKKTIHYGQFTDDGELLGIIAYLKGLPFHAFSYYFIKETIKIHPLLSYIKTDLRIPDGSIGSTLVNERDQTFFLSQIEPVHPVKEMLLMKHTDLACLPPTDDRVIRLDLTHFDMIQLKMKEFNAMAFIEEEFNFPFFGVMQNEDLIAVGGYHIFDRDYVEVGNIGTVEHMRRKGWGKRISAELTRKGREISKDVYLYVFSDNIPAVKLYESLGYQCISKFYLTEFDM